MKLRTDKFSPVQRLRAAWRWVRARRWRTSLFVGLSGFVLLNVWAFRHAWTMTHYASGGPVTIRPEQMSMLGKLEVLVTGVNLPRPENERTPADLDLPYATHRIPVTDGIELEAWYVPRENARAVVALYHGYGSCKGRLLGEAQAFQDLGCATLLVDFRGSGGSSGDATTLGMFEAADVAASCRLARELAPDQPLILYGRSMGSVAILRAIAHEGVEPEGIIIECPFDRLLRTVQHRFTVFHLPSFPCAELLLFWGGVQHGMNGFAHNPVDYAARVDCPVLQLHGTLDRRVLESEARSVFEALGGEKQFEVFPETGHESCFSSRPDQWNRLVARFLDRNVAKQVSAAP
jgi:uncharacterized protein